MNIFQGDTHFRRTFFIILPLLICSLVILTLHPDTTKADALPVVNESGTLSEDETWTAGSVYMIGSLLTVPNGITLTIEPGVIVKGGVFSNGIQVNPGATLNVNGASGNPAYFTSYEDDSLGGDSTGDGATTGSVGDYNRAIDNEGGTVDVSYSMFKYASQVVYGSATQGGYTTGSLTISDSDLSHIANGISYSDGPTSLQRNSFDMSNSPNNGTPISLSGIPDLTGVVLSGTDQNTITGNGSSDLTQTAYLNGTVPSAETWTLSDSSGVIPSFGTSGMISVAGTLDIDVPVALVHNNVYDQGTVNVASGTTLKLSGGAGIQALSGANLNVNGTSTDPVYFTSYEDDSLGGDSTADGATTGSVGDYNRAIDNEGGTVAVSYGVFKYASQAVYGSATQGGYTAGSLTIADSDFSHISNGISYTDGSTSLQRNSFDMSTSPNNGTPLSLSGIPDLTGVVLSGANQNTVTGNGSSDLTKMAFLQGTVPSGETWTISSSTGFLLAFGSPSQMSVAGTLNLDVPVVLTYNNIYDQGTVNIAAGTILKASSGSGIQVASGATLNVNGTSTDPVYFTSSEDDSLGGDSTADGATTGSVGDYNRAIDNEGGTVAASYANMKYGSLGYLQTSGESNFEHSNIDHATTGLQVNNGSAIFRGSIHSVTKGIYACNWQFSCSVDAADVDWGSADGPFPSAGALICGTVTVNPWTYGGSNYSNSNLFETPACDSSATPSAQLQSRITSYQNEIANLNIDCSNSYQDACNYINTYNACIQSSWNAAASNFSFSMPSGSPISDPVGYTTLVFEAATSYVESIEPGSVTGMTFSVGGELFSELSTVSGLNGAYDRCLSTAHTDGY